MYTLCGLNGSYVIHENKNYSSPVGRNFQVRSLCRKQLFFNAELIDPYDKTWTVVQDKTRFLHDDFFTNNERMSLVPDVRAMTAIDAIRTMMSNTP